MVDMKNDTTTNKQTVITGEYWGGCPHCGKTDGLVNFGEEHWFVCGEHRARWFAASALFTPCEEDDQNMREIASCWPVASFMEVNPIYPADGCGTDWRGRVAALPKPSAKAADETPIPF